MILLWLPLVLLLAAPLAWALGRLHPSFSRWTACAALALDGALLCRLSARQEISFSWIKGLGSSFHLAIDGISLLLVALTLFLGLVSVLGSKNKPCLFYAMLLWLLSSVVVVFLAVDLFLFYTAWELMLIPAYFLIALWGSGDCRRAANRFFLFTQLGGLLLIAAILALYCIHGHQTFDYKELFSTPLSSMAATLLVVGFSIAFFVKLPLFPLHTWLPEAYSEAPCAVSLLLAGLLSKTGAYGLIRFVLPLLPQTSLAPIGWALGAVTIVYGAGMAFAQTDFKRLLAYSSLSHMGFVAIGILSGSTLALQGAFIIMLAHGISISALFLLAGEIEESLGTRDIARMGGLWRHGGGIALFFAAATFGLPGLGNFVGEFLVLLGMVHVNAPTAAVAALGLVLSAVYALQMMQKVFFGNPGLPKLLPLPIQKLPLYGVMMALLLGLGLFPGYIINLLSLAVRGM